MACGGNAACKMNHEKITPELRTKMAAAHAEMAECLKSEKPMEDCHKIMAEHMDAHMDGTKACPMHDKMHPEETKKKIKN